GAFRGGVVADAVDRAATVDRVVVRERRTVDRDLAGKVEDGAAQPLGRLEQDRITAYRLLRRADHARRATRHGRVSVKGRVDDGDLALHVEDRAAHAGAAAAAGAATATESGISGLVGRLAGAAAATAETARGPGQDAAVTA